MEKVLFGIQNEIKEHLKIKEGSDKIEWESKYKALLEKQNLALEQGKGTWGSEGGRTGWINYK